MKINNNKIFICVEPKKINTYGGNNVFYLRIILYCTTIYEMF